MDTEIYAAATVAARTARLQAWRLATARTQGIAAFRVLTNATLARLAASRVPDLAALAAVNGIGPFLCATYGAALVELLAGDDCPADSPPPLPALEWGAEGSAPAEAAVEGGSEPPRLRDRPRVALPAAGWVPPAAFAAALAGLKTRERVALDLYYGLTLGQATTLPQIAAILGVQDRRARGHLRLGWTRLVRHATHPPATHPWPEAPGAVLATLLEQT
ncbi:MAG: HRDC domain-containing protein [Chloroflexota bacterium]|nr:HRDC domain-containing protein [Chloroflexota bacterium]